MKKIAVLCALFAALCASCALEGPRTVRYPNSITPGMQARFNSAYALYKSRRFGQSDSAFEKFIAEMPYTELTDEARFLRGEIAFVKRDYGTAIAFYAQSTSQIVSPKVAPKSHFKSALAYFKSGKPKESLDELVQIGRRDSSAILRIRADSLGIKASKSTGLPPNSAIAWNLFLLDDYAEAKGTESAGVLEEEIVPESAALAEAKRWVGDRTVTVEEIEALPMKLMKGKRSGGFAAYKQALTYHESGDTKAATRAFRSYVSTYPKHEYYGSARLLMVELGGEVGDAAGSVVGVLLPLSGKYATYGEATLHGIECAVGVYEPCTGPGGMKLVIRDSESALGGIAGAVDALAGENVAVILGPLVSATAMEAASRAQELGIPLISLSQRDGVAEVGNYIFRNSASDSSEMITLADFAVGALKLNRFYIVYPPNKKGAEYKLLFTDAVSSLGGTVVGTKSFAPPSHTLVIDELRGRYLTEHRGGSAGESQSGEEIGLDLPPSDGNYDAMFIADSLGIANFIAGKANIGGRTRLLGISKWGDEGLAERASANVNGGVFADSFYKGAPDPLVFNFVAKFKDAYGAEPTLLEALGYDAARLVINAVTEKGAMGRETLRDAFARTKGFPGVTGKITFNKEGDAQRELWVLQIKDGRIVPAK